MKANTFPIRTQDERVLVVDDDTEVSNCVACLLRTAGFMSECVTTGSAGLARARAEPFDLIISDLKLPDISGLDVLAGVHDLDQERPVILMTGYSSVESAVEALRRGAVDYVIKPFNNDDFLFSVERAIRERRMRRENAILKRSLKRAFSVHKIIGESEGIRRVLDLIERVANSDASVLIEGESGTGKELVAQAIHYSSYRADSPFVPVNCGAIPGELLESELFGHARGAYTGAINATDGLLREANDGTLFLDEISELGLGLQVKLLRALQERQVRPLGSKQTYATNARYVAASNRNLQEAMRAGLFRADLFYRLNVININIPPLRERGRDVDILADHFITQHARRLGKKITGMTDHMRTFLRTYRWPGNVRELENLIERSVILAEGEMLSLDDAQPATQVADMAHTGGTHAAVRPMTIEEYIQEVVRRYQDRHTEIELAAMLGIGRKALWMRRRQWGLYRNGRPHQESAVQESAVQESAVVSGFQ